MLNLLRVIDNPLQDIPLLSVLLSPLYGFTPDELAELRVLDRRAPLYLCMTASDSGHCRESVSYTHLDAYKRQASPGYSRIDRTALPRGPFRLLRPDGKRA